MSREANLRQGARATDSDLVRRRDAVLSDSYRLFYQHPVELVSGAGAHLYDTAGREYIDMYNNVPAIGHSHPLVTEYVSKQLATLNTHTRYVTPGVVDYSEALLAQFPTELDRVTYACTGSEAVDLAVRMARYFTGRSGIIVTGHAYHGTTTATAELSPSLGPGNRLSRQVELVTVPDPDYCATDPTGACQMFEDEIVTAITRLRERGIGLAAVLVDSIMSSDGVRPEPLGLLPTAAAIAHRHGGLYIADEVQPGFGRTGSMWGFARHPGEPAANATSPADEAVAGSGSFVPDIAVLGKPMGNGMPISAVVHKREVGREFGQNVRYFNTFGGNPVSIAAARAVLEVIHADDLPRHAERLGDYLAGQLGQITGAGVAADGYAEAGDAIWNTHTGAGIRFSPVRHAGLFLGLDTLDDSGAANPTAANVLVNEMREAGVLISASGADANTLKIRPPLAITQADVNRFLDVFARLLKRA